MNLDLNEPYRENAKPTKRHLLTPKTVTTMGTWNVRTMYATGTTRILMNELQRFRWDIIGLSETHLLGIQEYRTKEGKIYCAGGENQHQAGVALVLSRRAQRCLLECRPTNKRIIMARFQTIMKPITIIQVYAPTAEAADDEINNFYQELQTQINTTPKNDTLIIMGDFNAKVGKDNNLNSNVMGPYGMGRKTQ